MVQFAGTKGKCCRGGCRAIACILCLLLLTSMAGCGVTDKMNGARNTLLEILGIKSPDNYGPRIDPGTIIDPFDPSYVPKEYDPVVSLPGTDIIWGIPEPGTTAPPGESEPPSAGESQMPDATGELKVNPAEFLPTVAPVATAERYNDYLMNTVYNPIVEIINGLSIENKDKVYFRVFNSGQEYDSVEHMCSPGRVYDSSCIGTSQSFGGTALPTFVAGWLGQVPGNVNNIDSARSRWLTEINSQSIAEDTNWLEASTKVGVSPKLVLMWGNERLSPGSLKDYLALIDSQAIGTIPDITFRMYTSLTNYATVTINPTTGQLGELHYKDAMQKSDIDRVFTKQNQFVTRSCAVIDKILLDDSSILSCYLDGYNKTLIYLAVDKGYTLQEVFGAGYGTVANIIQKAARPNNGAGLQGSIEGLTMVPSGVKGTG